MKARSAASGDKGSVLMEYVVLCCFTMAAIFIAWRTELYDYEKGWTGHMGTGIVNYYQRVLGGITMPIP